MQLILHWEMRTSNHQDFTHQAFMPSRIVIHSDIRSSRFYASGFCDIAHRHALRHQVIKLLHIKLLCHRASSCTPTSSHQAFTHQAFVPSCIVMHSDIRPSRFYASGFFAIAHRYALRHQVIKLLHIKLLCHRAFSCTPTSDHQDFTRQAFVPLRIVMHSDIKSSSFYASGFCAIAHRHALRHQVIKLLRIRLLCHRASSCTPTSSHQAFTHQAFVPSCIVMHSDIRPSRFYASGFFAIAHRYALRHQVIKILRFMLL
jgi:hypothetical protein